MYIIIDCMVVHCEYWIANISNLHMRRPPPPTSAPQPRHGSLLIRSSTLIPYPYKKKTWTGSFPHHFPSVCLDLHYSTLHYAWLLNTPGFHSDGGWLPLCRRSVYLSSLDDSMFPLLCTCCMASPGCLLPIPAPSQPVICLLSLMYPNSAPLLSVSGLSTQPDVHWLCTISAGMLITGLMFLDSSQSLLASYLLGLMFSDSAPLFLLYTLEDRFPFASIFQVTQNA